MQLPNDDPQNSIRNEMDASIEDELEKLRRARKISADISGGGIISQNKSEISRRKKGSNLRQPSSIIN